MNSNEETSGLLMNFLLGAGLLVLLGGVLIYPALSGHTQTRKAACQNNLRMLGTYMKTYQTSVQPGRYAPLDGGGIADNWGDFLRKITVKGTQWKEIDDGLFVCPVKGGAPGPHVNNYWWANPESRFFPEGKITEDLPEDTPIVGDAPNNHEEKVHNVLLFGGSIQEVTPGDDLWDKAYGPGGALAP